MRKCRSSVSTLLILVLVFPLIAAPPHKVGDIPTPPEYTRVPVPSGTFAASLRELTLMPPAPLLAGDGKTWLCDYEKVATTSIEPFDNKRDVGVDGIVRMWGDYLWSRGSSRDISFPLDNGQLALWRDWRDGLRPRSRGGKFIFVQETTPNGSRDNYLRFLSFVAEEMGAIALKRESTIIMEDSATVGDIVVALKEEKESRIGIFLDMCKGPRGERLFLLGTCGTPSTNLYIMRPYSPVQGLNEWFTLEGAEWAIGEGARTDLRRVTLR
jgi:hypothetical protein